MSFISRARQSAIGTAATNGSQGFAGLRIRLRARPLVLQALVRIHRGLALLWHCRGRCGRRATAATATTEQNRHDSKGSGDFQKLHGCSTSPVA